MCAYSIRTLSAYSAYLDAEDPSTERSASKNIARSPFASVPVWCFAVPVFELWYCHKQKSSQKWVIRFNKTYARSTLQLVQFPKISKHTSLQSPEIFLQTEFHYPCEQDRTQYHERKLQAKYHSRRVCFHSTPWRLETNPRGVALCDSIDETHSGVDVWFSTTWVHSTRIRWDLDTELSIVAAEKYLCSSAKREFSIS